MNELLGNRIKALRSARNFTQEQIADQIGVSRQKYARIESGANSITLDILSKIAEMLEVTVGDITKRGDPYMSLLQFEDDIMPFTFADVLILRYLVGTADEYQTVKDFDAMNWWLVTFHQNFAAR